MAKIRVAINGAGRIGRSFYKLACQRPELDVISLNDLGEVDNIAYLLKYDSAYGRSGLNIKVAADKKSLDINGNHVAFLSEKDPAALPWKDLKIDVVVESTGFF